MTFECRADEYEECARQLHEAIAEGQSIEDTTTLLRLLAAPAEGLARYSIDLDGYGYVEVLDPDGEYVKFADLAASPSDAAAPLREALRPWLRHKVWCNCKTDDPPDTERCKCGLRAALTPEAADD